MLDIFRKHCLQRRMKKSIRLVTDAIYSEQFDMDVVIRKLVRNNDSVQLLRAYIAINTAAQLTEPIRRTDLECAITEFSSFEQRLKEPDCEKILELQKQLADIAWQNRKMEILTRKLAHTNSPDSYDDLIYMVEYTKKGPTSSQERKDYREVVSVLEHSTNAVDEPDLQNQGTEQQIQDELDELYRERELLSDPATISSFGQMSFDGDGVPQDYIAAANWFRIAAERGYAKAQHNLGLMYEEGQGVPQDYAEAYKWYHMAADQGLAASQNNLANLYEAGNGVAQDHAEAIKWYRKGAENGDENALLTLNRLEASTDLHKYRNIMLGFGELMATNVPLIGDCSILPYPKKTILYAIRWLMDDYESKRESATDQTALDTCNKMLTTLTYLFTQLANNWQEIDPEDKHSIVKLDNCTSFPDWALPLKRKYINDERASREAYEVTIRVVADRLQQEKTPS